MSALLPVHGNAATTLLVTLFRLNGSLLTTGDRLVADLGLTAARWQVLGVIANAPAPLPVASVARNIGLTRQGVRQVVAELVKRGFVVLEPNPHHRRASLVVLTDDGRTVQGLAKERWDRWTCELVDGLADLDIQAAAGLLQVMLGRLGADTSAREASK